MLTSVKISNYKSIETVKLSLGRINVLIGENGAGKSNILEAIALAGAASAGKLDNEFLSSRGIRVTEPHLMRPAFSEGKGDAPIEVTFIDDDKCEYPYILTNDNAPYSQWQCAVEERDHQTFNFGSLLRTASDIGSVENMPDNLRDEMKILFDAMISKLKDIDEPPTPGQPISISVSVELDEDGPLRNIIKRDRHKFTTIAEYLKSFIVFSPENTSLRLFERPGQIEPLGINGEGLFKLLTVLSESDEDGAIDSIREGLSLFGWFRGFEATKATPPALGGIQVKDRFVEATNRILDQKSVNEGFLFILFYGALFSSKMTPRFFAIDNIDASLNPKLCQKLMSFLTRLAKKNDKQVILTTHNPAVLDGLNLDDDEQRLFVVSRGGNGQTRVRRVEKKHPVEGAPEIRLSEAFLRGSLGGLPKGF